MLKSTGGRARTDTVLSHHRILSPARLPIPPLRRAEPQHYTNVHSPLDVRGEYVSGQVLWYSKWSQLRSSQGAIVEPVREAYQRDGKHTYRVSASRCIVIYTASMSGNHKQGNRLGMDLSFYAPSFRLKQLAWSGYGFGHTSRRRPGDVRGTAVGKRGRFRSLGTKRGGDA